MLTTRIKVIMPMALICLSAIGAQAHEFPVERAIVAQMDENQASILVSFQDPRKARADLIFQRYDLNKDGKINEQEATIAAKLLLPMALQGLQLEIPGHKPRAHSPKLKIRRTKKGELIMMALVNYALPKWKNKTRSFKVSLKKDRKYPPIQVSFQAIGQSKLVSITPAKRQILHPGQSLTGTFMQTKAKKSKSK